MNILVTGANGQLGLSLREWTQNSINTYTFTDVSRLEGYDVSYLDITDISAIRQMVKEKNIKCIINCAAWTDVDGAEDPSKYETVERLNAKAPENLAIAMKEVGGLLIHVSTDYVFGGAQYNTPCKEDQKGTPTGVYGLTKLHGEQLIQKSGCDFIILRTAWLYSEYGKNFVKTMLNLTANKPQLKVVFDQCGTPTYAGDLAHAIYIIVENKQYEGNTGIYHFSNEGVTSWFDFTKMIAKLARHTDCDIQPCYSSDYPSKVTRPSYSVLDKTKFKQTFKQTIPYWTESLQACIVHLQESK